MDKDKYMTSFVWYLIRMIQMDLFTKQKQTHKHRKLMITKNDSREVEGKRDKLGGWDHIYTLLLLLLLSCSSRV